LRVKTKKFNLYARLQTLEHYLLVNQERVEVEYRWLDERAVWQSEFYDQRNAVIQLHGFDLEVNVGEFYRRVNFS
jgi:Uma2 family endonuclease